MTTTPTQLAFHSLRKTLNPLRDIAAEMSSYGRNNGSRNVPLNRPTFINNQQKQIMCRLCDRILHSTQALITHIESHIVHSDIASDQHNNNPLIQPNNNNNINNRIISFLVQQNPNFYYRPAVRPVGPPALPLIPAQGPPVQVQRPIPIRLGPPSLPLALGGARLQAGTAGNLHHHHRRTVSFGDAPANNIDRAGLGGLGRPVKRPRVSVEDVVSPVDGTRPFLSQLDRPIPKIIDLEIGNEEDGLDLTLKL